VDLVQIITIQALLSVVTQPIIIILDLLIIMALEIII